MYFASLSTPIISFSFGVEMANIFTFLNSLGYTIIPKNNSILLSPKKESFFVILCVYSIAKVSIGFIRPPKSCTIKRPNFCVCAPLFSFRFLIKSKIFSVVIGGISKSLPSWGFLSCETSSCSCGFSPTCSPIWGFACNGIALKIPKEIAKATTRFCVFRYCPKR